jgi:hypothetical protein
VTGVLIASRIKIRRIRTHCDSPDFTIVRCAVIGAQEGSWCALELVSHWSHPRWSVVRYSFQREAAARIVGILLLIGSAVEQTECMGVICAELCVASLDRRASLLARRLAGTTRRPRDRRVAMSRWS